MTERPGIRSDTSQKSGGSSVPPVLISRDPAPDLNSKPSEEEEVRAIDVVDELFDEERAKSRRLLNKRLDIPKTFRTNRTQKGTMYNDDDKSSDYKVIYVRNLSYLILCENFFITKCTVNFSILVVS